MKQEIKLRAPDDFINRLREISTQTGIPQSVIVRNGTATEVTRLEAEAAIIKSYNGDKKMNITTYYIHAPYSINGHKNITGLAIADDINKRLNDADCTQNRRSYEHEISSLEEGDVDLYGLEIKEQFYCE